MFAPIAALLILAAPALAQRDLRDLPDPDPKAELASFKVLDGYEVNLFAAEPMVIDPIHTNFDARGRLWVASSPIYPHIKPGEKPTDKIYVLEDTDGDGKADKSTIFADDLLIPTAVLPDASGNGAYVANSTELLYLQDTDGDGKADQRRIVLSGFGTEDTHHILHTFRWGPDGAFYFNQSIYIHSHIETPWGVKRLGGSGTWKFRPESMKLEVFMRGLVNPWGHVFTPWGTSFATDGAGGEGINYVFPEAAFVSAVGTTRILRGLNPGQPKHCGLEIVSGRHFGDEWNGTLVANDFRGNRVNRFALEEEGSGFVSRQLPDLITSDHIAFRPVDVKMGPDGALYFADWYNPIIQHGEVDFRDPRRDHLHGRIWRVTAKGKPLVKAPAIVDASVEQLLEMLKLPEEWTRTQAKVQLQARSAENVKPALESWVSRLDNSDPDFEHHRLEALWVYQGLGVVEPELLKQVLASRSYNARAAAVRVLGEWHAQVPETLKLLEQAVADGHPRVRLEAVCALRELDTPRAAEVALTALDGAMDPSIDYALWFTVRDLSPSWLPGFQSGDLRFAGKASHIAFALRAIEKPEALTPLVKLLQEGKIAAAEKPATISLIGDLGDPAALATIFELALGSEENRQPTLQALLKASLQRQARPTGDLAFVLRLFESKDEPTRSAAARLAGAWQISAAHPWLVGFAEGADSSDALRAAAVEGLAAFGPGGKETLIELSKPEQPIKVRAAMIPGLVAVDLPAAAGRAAEILPSIDKELDAGPIFDAFLRHEQGPDALAAALDGKTLTAPIAALGVRKGSASGRPVDPLNAALTKAGGLTQMVQQLTPEQMTKLIGEVSEQGDAQRGEAVYRRAVLTCVTCHAIAGGGGRVGPDLVSLGASAPVDYIVESLLEPGKKIKEGFHMTVVTTKDNQVVAGGLMRETDRELVLRDATDKEIIVPLNNVKSKQVVPASLMPPGLTATLRRDEFVDLVRFLSELGKDGAFKAPAGRFVRAWEVLEGSPEIGRRMSETSVAFVTADDPLLVWKPAASTVSGELPVSELPPSRRWSSDFGAARFAIEVTTPGKVGLKLNDPAAVQIWRGSEMVPAAREIVLDLPKGVHVFTLAVDVKERATPLSIEVVDVEGSEGRAQPATP